jgi:hypothetical protein
MCGFLERQRLQIALAALSLQLIGTGFQQGRLRLGAPAAEQTGFVAPAGR